MGGPPTGSQRSVSVLQGIVDQKKGLGRLAQMALDVAIEGEIRLSSADFCRIVELIDLSSEAEPFRKVASAQMLLIAR